MWTARVTPPTPHLQHHPVYMQVAVDPHLMEDGLVPAGRAVMVVRPISSRCLSRTSPAPNACWLKPGIPTALKPKPFPLCRSARTHAAHGGGADAVARGGYRPRTGR